MRYQGRFLSAKFEPQNVITATVICSMRSSRSGRQMTAGRLFRKKTMSITTAHLETLHRQLRELGDRLHEDHRPGATELDENDFLVAAAVACDFLLPSLLTIDQLAATVQKKIENVDVLLERSRMHESLPSEAQAAAEEENRYMEEDYASSPALPGSEDGSAASARQRAV